MSASVELRSPGFTTVAPEVLLSIARLTALQVEGVHDMAKVARRGKDAHVGDGVVAHIVGDLVSLDLYLVLEKDTNLRQVAREVQDRVARAISEMVGMQAGGVHIHIEDIYYPELI